jgi:hypothetical protein
MSDAMAAIDTLIRSFFDETWIFVFLFREVLRMNKILPCAALAATPFKINSKFLFKKAAILSAILLIFIDISSPLKAAEGAPNPAGFDILGMKLGMSVAEIEAAIKAYNPAFEMRIDKKPVRDQRLGVGKFVQIVQASRRGSDVILESISVLFTVAQPSRAFYIGRYTQFAPEHQPLTDKTEQQLREKYGPESNLLSSTGLISIDWVFDKTGKQIFPKADMRLFQACASAASYSGNFDGASGPDWLAALMSPESNPTGCGINLQVSSLPSTDTHLLQSLNEQIDGKSIAIDDIQKLMAEAKATKEQQRQQQEQKASGVKPVL